MPNRILRQAITRSEKIESLTCEEEVCFTRLIVVADDFGRMDARGTILKAECFPVRESVTAKDCEHWVKALARKGLLLLYEVDGGRYLLLRQWDQRLRSYKAKYPEPPSDVAALRESEFPEERDIEDLLFEHLCSSLSFAGRKLTTVNRQVRVGDSYIDILAAPFLLELKRGGLSNKSIGQIRRYLEMAPGHSGVLIGTRVSPDFDVELCKAAGIAVLLYDEDLRFLLHTPSGAVQACDIPVLTKSSPARAIADATSTSSSTSSVDAFSTLSGGDAHAREAEPPAETSEPPPPRDSAKPKKRKPPASANGSTAHIAELLAGNGVRVRRGDSAALDRLAAGVCGEPCCEGDILGAIALARERRGESTQPVNVGLVEALVPEYRKQQAAAPPGEAWWASHEGIEREGREMGMKPGGTESYEAYKARIWAAKRSGKAP